MPDITGGENGGNIPNPRHTSPTNQLANILKQQKMHPAVAANRAYIQQRLKRQETNNPFDPGKTEN